MGRAWRFRTTCCAARWKSFWKPPSSRSRTSCRSKAISAGGERFQFARLGLGWRAALPCRYFLVQVLDRAAGGGLEERRHQPVDKTCQSRLQQRTGKSECDTLMLRIGLADTLRM